MATPTLAHGAILKKGDGATPEVFTKIPLCKGIKYSPGESEKVDTTNHDSLAAEHIKGLLASGSVPFLFLFDPTSTEQKELRDLNDEEQPTNFQLITKSGMQIDFAATVSMGELDLDVKSKAEEWGCTLDISGIATYDDP